jgi:hypothetical protein
MTADGLGYAVPAYFHPAVAEAQWARLAAEGRHVRFVVVNVHNGPGDDVDPAYVRAVDPLREAGVPLVGYVDTAYGTRSGDDVIADAFHYRLRYGITGVFLDQVSSDPQHLADYRRHAGRLRHLGVDLLVLNPGAYPYPGYLELGDVTVCFEGTWEDYQAMVVPEWVQSTPVSRICHLVYGAPCGVTRDPEPAVRGRHVGTVCLTEGTLPNPWDRLPGVLDGA